MSDPINIPVAKMPLTHADIGRAQRLMGFDHGDDIYHVLCFDWGDDGGAIGIWKQGSAFCARLTLDDLARFWIAAEKNGPSKPATTP